MFVRDEWTLFRSVNTLSQKAGVPPERLRRLVAKELTDNALDVAGCCRVELIDGGEGGFYVEDDGPGIPGEPEDVAALFSIRRPLTSSKLLRLPTRGALGNGLRVVAGAVLASRGVLYVFTRGQALRLQPQDSGETRVEAYPWDRYEGTRVEVCLGAEIPEDSDCLVWARRAILLAGAGRSYVGKTSPLWYDPPAFFELLQAAGSRTVAAVLAEMDGSHGSKLKSLLGDTLTRPAASLTRDEATGVLGTVRADAKTIAPEWLGYVGPIDTLPRFYARKAGYFTASSGEVETAASVPFVVEAWAEIVASDGDEGFGAFVNRTPITGEIRRYHDEGKADLVLFGCGLQHRIPVGRRRVVLVVNVQTPYMPITTDGKAPNLRPFLAVMTEVMQAATGKAARDYQHQERLATAEKGSILPRRKRGRQSEAQNAAHQSRVEEFCELIQQINSTLDFRVSSRGWCYILEDYGLEKGEFDQAQDLINDCRKEGLLPVDICAEDTARQFACLEEIDQEEPWEYAEQLQREQAKAHRHYHPVSFWEYQEYYLEVMVEKIDLKTLWEPICQQYHVPIVNNKGWYDINTRVSIMQRFKYWEGEGKRVVLLYAGDFDPSGFNISNHLRGNLETLMGAADWDPEGLEIDRFGLNFDFIEELGLTWIDNLMTSSSGNLADPKHPDHGKPYVQDYIRKYGVRKCEANALVTQPQAGRQLLRDTLARYLDEEGIAFWKAECERKRGEVRHSMKALQRRKVRREVSRLLMTRAARARRRR